MSWIPFELSLAVRYLRPKRTFVSVITLISVAGVTIGVAVLIIVMSVMTGFDRELRDKLLGFNAHMNITQVNAPMTNWERILTVVQSKHRGVLFAVPSTAHVHQRQNFHDTNDNITASISNKLSPIPPPPPLSARCI